MITYEQLKKMQQPPMLKEPEPTHFELIRKVHEKILNEFLLLLSKRKEWLITDVIKRSGYSYTKCNNYLQELVARGLATKDKRYSGSRNKAFFAVV